MPTIRDVAKRAGVGIATVSRVLNGSSQVRESTRQRVLDAIADLNYSPNQAARRLSSGKTFTIGVVSPFFTFPSFVERLTGIQDVLDESEYDLVLYSIRSTEQLQRRLRILIGENRVDGLIVLSLPFSERDLRTLKPDFPIVTVDNSPAWHYPSVVIDDVAGGALATRYLIEHGHRALGFVGDRTDSVFRFTSTERRLEGFRNALTEAGLEFRETWCWQGEHSQEAARQAAWRILQQPNRPSAIFAAMDTLAFGVLQAVREMGMRVPEDVAVIGFDDIAAAGYVNLTTVSQHLVESGRIAAQRMLDWLRSGEIERTPVQLPLKIVERATV